MNYIHISFWYYPNLIYDEMRHFAIFIAPDILLIADHLEHFYIHMGRYQVYQILPVQINCQNEKNKYINYAGEDKHQ